MADITFKHVVKTYDNKNTVVPDLNLEIHDKEFIVLVGPSGCGKSTTLRMIAGLEEISEGDLYIGDRRVNDVAPKDRDIAMVFQSYALYPHMTVYKNMSFALELHGTPKDEIDKKVREAAEILGLTEYLDRKPKALSGGQRQRVALGRAMVRNPAVFLLDEPLSNLDAKLRGQMRVEIASLYHKLNSTFIYVTHDQTEAMTLGTRIVVMKDGVVQQVDTPERLFRYPANQFVAGFIGTPPMNFAEAVVKYDPNGGLYLEENGNRIELTKEKAEKLRRGNYIGRAVTLGIRPEHVILNPTEGGSVHGAGTVEVYEMLGSEAMVYLNREGSREKMIIKTDTAAPVRPGEKVSYAYLPEKIHLFDRIDGRTITN